MGYSAEDFYEVVNVYNQSMGPIPFVVYAAALFAAMVAAVRSRLMSVAACCVLAAMWLINGLVFHLNFYATINSFAWTYAALFIVQGALFLVVPFVVDRGLVFARGRDLRHLVGLVLILFSIFLYPWFHSTEGLDVKSLPLLGTAPAPTTFFTIGAVLTGSASALRWLMPLPALFAFVGAIVAFRIGITVDIALLPAGVIGGIYWVRSLMGLTPDIADISEKADD